MAKVCFISKEIMVNKGINKTYLYINSIYSINVSCCWLWIVGNCYS